MFALVLYPLLCSTLYYLGARAAITHFIWKRYPKWLDSVAYCMACSGFWYGLVVGTLGAVIRLPFGPLPGRTWWTPIVVGLCSITWTPFLGRLHLLAMTESGGEAGGSEGRTEVVPGGGAGGSAGGSEVGGEFEQ